MPSMDSYESNNTLSTATNLTLSTSGSRSFTIHSSSDVDYIKIDLDSYGTSSNYVSIDNISGGDIDMQLYDANGNLLSTSNYGGTSSERISLSGRSAGTYVPALLFVFLKDHLQCPVASFAHRIFSFTRSASVCIDHLQ